MKNRHFCVICMLLPVIFLCTFLAGCGKEPQADPADVPFLSQVWTQDLEALPHTMEVRWQSGDLELLDATEGEGGYLLLVQDANDTYQITLDDNFNEVNRQKTSVSHAKRFLHTKQGVFAYAPNESGTYDVWKDLSCYLPVGGDDTSDFQMVVADQQLYICANGRLFYQTEEISLDTLRAVPYITDQPDLLYAVAVVPWKGRVYAVLREEEAGSMLYVPLKDGAVLLEDAALSFTQGVRFAAAGERIYYVGEDGVIYFLRCDLPELGVAEQAFFDLTQDGLQAGDIRAVLARENGKLMLLLRDKLVEVVPVVS